MVVTNGFHFSRTVSVKYKPGMQFYEVEGFVDNVQLLGGLFMMLFFFLIYIGTGIRLFMIFANLPLLIVVYILYVKRRSFILIHSLKPEKKVS